MKAAARLTVVAVLLATCTVQFAADLAKAVEIIGFQTVKRLVDK